MLCSSRTVWDVLWKFLAEGDQYLTVRSAHRPLLSPLLFPPTPHETLTPGFLVKNDLEFCSNAVYLMTESWSAKWMALHKENPYEGRITFKNSTHKVYHPLMVLEYSTVNFLQNCLHMVQIIVLSGVTDEGCQCVLVIAGDGHVTEKLSLPSSQGHSSVIHICAPSSRWCGRRWRAEWSIIDALCTTRGRWGKKINSP